MIELNEIEWQTEGYLLIEEAFDNLLNSDRLSEQDKAAFAKGKQQCLDLVLQGHDPKVVMEQLLEAMRKDIRKSIGAPTKGVRMRYQGDTMAGGPKRIALSSITGAKDIKLKWLMSTGAVTADKAKANATRFVEKFAEARKELGQNGKHKI